MRVFIFAILSSLIIVACNGAINDRGDIQSASTITKDSKIIKSNDTADENNDDDDLVVNPASVTLFAGIRNRCDILDSTGQRHRVRCQAVSQSQTGFETHINSLPNDIELSWSAPTIRQGSVMSLSCNTSDMAHSQAMLSYTCEIDTTGTGLNLQNLVNSAILQFDLLVSQVQYVVPNPEDPPPSPNPQPSSIPTAPVRTVLAERTESQLVTIP